MSEITVNPDQLPVPYQDVKVRPLNFSLALIFAPIITGFCLFWLYFVPAVAVVFGAVPYLLFGGPAFWRAVKTGPLKLGRFALVGVLANFAFCAVAAGVILVADLAQFDIGMPAHDLDTFAILYLGLGSIFAPIWAAVFCALYRNNDEYQALKKGDI